MATTSHGYHIPGTSHANDDRTIPVFGCDGPEHCRVCRNEAVAVTIEFDALEVHVKKVRRIPIEVEAVRWEQSVPMKVLIEFTNHLVRMDDVNMIFNVYDRIDNKWNPFNYGDWIIKGTDGQFFPCPHADFIANFEN